MYTTATKVATGLVASTVCGWRSSMKNFARTTTTDYSWSMSIDRGLTSESFYSIGLHGLSESQIPDPHLFTIYIIRIFASNKEINKTSNLKSYMSWKVSRNFQYWPCIPQPQWLQNSSQFLSPRQCAVRTAPWNLYWLTMADCSLSMTICEGLAHRESVYTIPIKIPFYFWIINV